MYIRNVINSGGKKIKFLLIYPPSEPSLNSSSNKETAFKGIAPPLGLLYIARVLEDQGDNITILDFSAESFDEQKLKNETEKADIVGLTVLSYSLQCSKEIITKIKQFKPQITVIIGGPHCNLFPEKSLKETGADICVQGDGELIINDIKNTIIRKGDFSKIPGIYYKENEKIRKGAPLELIEDLNTLAFPSRKLIEKYNYGKEYNPKIKKGEFTSVIMSRGCPYHCKFCSRNSVSMKKYRTRTVENVVKELIELSNQGYKYVAFEDDSFITNINEINRLFETIIKEKIKMKFIITAARVDAIDKELFENMRKAGVTHLQFGFESGNQDVLDFYNKNTTIEGIIKAVRLSNRMGFFTIGTFILGAPIETKDHFKRTLTFAKSLRLDSVSFLHLKYVAGSDLWCEAVEKGKITEDEYIVNSGSEKNLSIMSRHEIDNYCIKANREYFLRAKFMVDLLKKSLKNDDLGFLQSFISLFLSNIRSGFEFFGVVKK